jgi:hypothetical protein
MARISKRLRRLWDTYSFEGFRAEPVVRGVFGDPKVRIVTLKRRSKKHRVDAVAASRSGLQFKQYSHVPAGQVTHLPDFAVVPFVPDFEPGKNAKDP